MKRRLIIVGLGIAALLVLASFIFPTSFKNLFTGSKLPELRKHATNTAQSLQLGNSLERTESDQGYYTIKGSQHYSWSVRDAYNLPNLDFALVESIDKNMSSNGWTRAASLDQQKSLSEDFDWAKKHYNYLNVTYNKKSASEQICQRFSFWWNAQNINGGVANVFLYTEITDYC